jgi:phenylalanyl-tRNA synthetase beta chain
MRISYSWLRELVDTELTAAALAARLTNAGLAVDYLDEVDGDTYLEFDLTSNRPDALSHLGIAREVAAITGCTLRPPEAQLVEGAVPASSIVSVEIKDPDLCPRYCGRVVTGVRVGPSPEWMVRRLDGLGQRSINNVADVTNYVLLEQGHPLHAFDLDTLAGRRIVVRRARAGERIVTLERLSSGENEFREIELDDSVLVIADAERPVAIGGIKGGRDTGISGTTTNVLLEAAYFAPGNIRNSARRLGLATDASYRFERGADYAATVRAIDRAAALIAEVAGGEVCSGVIDCYPRPVERSPVPLRRSKAVRLAGFDISFAQILDALHRLGFRIETLADAEELLALAPSYRVDINMEEDLVEEVARLVGYDSVPARLPGWGGSGSYLPHEDRRRAVRDTLNGLGYSEAISLSFVDAALDSELAQRPDGGQAGTVTLLNPVLENRPRMRSTLLAGLIEAYVTNAHHSTRNVRLFEIGRRFIAQEEGRPLERETLALLASGLIDDVDFRLRREADFYDLKGAVEAVLERLGLAGFTFERVRLEYLHPGQAASIRIGNETVGVVGRLNPELATRRKLKHPIFVAELEFDRLLELETPARTYQRLPRFPHVVRDISLVVARTTSVAEILEAARALGVDNLAEVALYNIFSGGQLDPEQHSVTLRMTYRSDDRTLTDEEVTALHGRVVEALLARFDATLR